MLFLFSFLLDHKLSCENSFFKFTSGSLPVHVLDFCLISASPYRHVLHKQKACKAGCIH